MPTIGLCMIVRDEAHVVERCLDSARPLLDGAVVVDTGSEDGTPEIVRAYFARHGIPATVIRQPWRDFAHNRSAALALLRQDPAIDYALVLDADDWLAVAPGFDPAAFKAGLAADVYDLDIHHGGAVYRRPQLFANRLAFRYRSVLHEFLDIPPSARSHGVAAGLHVVYGGDGARSRDADKFARDAALLEAALAGEDDPFLRARYTFYLAQSLRDAGRLERAIAVYLDRAGLGFWDQEVFESLLNAGKLMAGQGAPTEAVLSVLDRASATVPERVEALHAAALICRQRGEWARGLAAAERGLGRPLPEAGLFLQPWIHAVGLIDEFAVNAYWAGRHMDCLVACAILLSRQDLDPPTRERIGANRDHAGDRLREGGSLWTATLKEGAPRIAVVTAYGPEEAGTLRRCIESVARQTVAADHLLIATGPPQEGLDGLVADHLHLGGEGGAEGRAALAAGGLLAAARGYTAICLLDAGCWYEPDHIEGCLLAALRVGFERCGVVAAPRRLRRPDLTVMPLPDEAADGFVDASGYLFLPAGFHLLGHWALVPRPLAEIGDRVFLLGVRASGLATGRSRSASVNRVATYAASYEALGEAPPAGARERPDHASFRAWIEALAPEAIATLRRQIGADPRDLYPTAPPAGAQSGSPPGPGGDFEGRAPAVNL
ncbi:glycosyltransferase [uncultured Methylobacterium sp.]|uniref:tetratricopeptide repeat-containing glycosyltransferase n=1 Tax=uncultured Methylobacterium sp. TaxID=157278 RepID=UPI002627EF44|nr:glycosyltransferase [uncultured Methylobacterium sp.]